LISVSRKFVSTVLVISLLMMITQTQASPRLLAKKGLSLAQELKELH